ncbi:hypothetical protein PIB30_101600 [Stylosanthes scabra]|uniref:Putative plant transposon protein domain-containing protein n=1 Tax=Stylosanthes scabra TaxID=79078 RepID=A0ABU6XZT7_9FABA|nr:hypothetical protein [Stylosanthes scabra]
MPTLGVRDRRLAVPTFPLTHNTAHTHTFSHARRPKQTPKGPPPPPLHTFTHNTIQTPTPRRPCLTPRRPMTDPTHLSQLWAWTSAPIKRRGWRRLASPQDEVAKAMVREFYANVGRTDEQMVGLEQHPYTSYVRGKTIDLSPENIRKVMRFKEETRGAQFNYHQRRPTKEELDLILRELCEDGATWKMGKGKDPKPIQLRRLMHEHL